MSSSVCEKRQFFLFKLLKLFNESFDMYKLRRFTALNFVFFEKIVANLTRLIPLYILFYEEMIKEEIEFADISKNDKVLHIGSGTIPATGIIICQKTNADITGIDINSESIKKSKIVIEKKFKSLNLRVKLADGANIDVSEYNKIIISDGINDLLKILTNISKSSKKGSIVILRKTIKNDAFELDNDGLNKNFDVKKISKHPFYGDLSSIMLVKK